MLPLECFPENSIYLWKIKCTIKLYVIEANETRDLNFFQYALKRDESKGSYYVRMFGNEISFDDFHAFKFENVMDNVDMEPLFEKLAKEHNIDYTSSGMFFDTAMVVPTVAGLPLRLKTDGTAVVNMKVRGKIDVRNLFKPKSAMVIQGSVRPR